MPPSRHSSSSHSSHSSSRSSSSRSYSSHSSSSHSSRTLPLPAGRAATPPPVIPAAPTAAPPPVVPGLLRGRIGPASTSRRAMSRPAAPACGRARSTAGDTTMSITRPPGSIAPPGRASRRAITTKTVSAMRTSPSAARTACTAMSCATALTAARMPSWI